MLEPTRARGAHLHRTPPPLKTLRRDVPPEVVRVVERMMAKDPAQRYQTPAEAASVLAPFATAKPPRRKKWPLVAAAFGFVAALALGVVIWNPEDAGTDLFLKTAFTLARALCVRAACHSDAEAADFRDILDSQGLVLIVHLPNGRASITQPSGQKTTIAGKYRTLRNT